MIVKINGSSVEAVRAEAVAVIDQKKARNEKLWKYAKFTLKVVGTTAIILVAGGGFDYAFATSGIDVEAKKLYHELAGIGKWIIIFKGGIDMVKSVGNGDFDGAKKHFLSYLLIYLALLGLPYGMDKVDTVFQNLQS